MMALVQTIRELEGKLLYKSKNLKYSNLLLVLILSVFYTLTSNAHTYKNMNVEIIHPWCYAASVGDNSMASLTISNDSDNDIELIGISSDLINHIMIMKDGKSVDKITVSKNGGIRGEDDFQVMFHGLKRSLVSGESIPAKLEFSSGMNINIKFVIGENTMLDEGEDMNETQEHHDHSNH